MARIEITANLTRGIQATSFLQYIWECKNCMYWKEWLDLFFLLDHYIRSESESAKVTTYIILDQNTTRTKFPGVSK